MDLLRCKSTSDASVTMTPDTRYSAAAQRPKVLTRNNPTKGAKAAPMIHDRFVANAEPD